MKNLTRLKPRRSGPPAYRAVLVTLLLGVISAYAHAQLLHSTPKDKSSVDQPPRQVNIWFNELLDEGFNAVEVYPVEQLNAETRTNLANQPPVVDPQDKTHLSATLKPLAPGKYIVDYRVLSRDGHTAPGRITFTVLPPR